MTEGPAMATPAVAVAGGEVEAATAAAVAGGAVESLLHAAIAATAKNAAYASGVRFEKIRFIQSPSEKIVSTPREGAVTLPVQGVHPATAGASQGFRSTNHLIAGTWKAGV